MFISYALFLISSLGKRFVVVVLDRWSSCTGTTAWDLAQTGLKLAILDDWSPYRAGRLSRFDCLRKRYWEFHAKPASLFLLCLRGKWDWEGEWTTLSQVTFWPTILLKINFMKTINIFFFKSSIRTSLLKNTTRPPP